MAHINNQDVTSKKRLLIDKIKSKYPDLNDEDEEAFYSKINEDYDDYDTKVKSYEENGQKLAELFDSDERAASFLMKWKNGADPYISLIEEFGDEFRDALDDPAMQDKYAEATKKYNEKLLKSRDLEKQANENLDASLEALDEAQEELGVDDEVITKTFELYNTIINDAIVNKVKKDTWIMFIKGLNYDTDVEDAERIGEVRGKNTKIDDLKVKRTPDVAPSLTGGRPPSEEPREDMGMFGREKQNIYAGMRRIKRN